MFPDLFTPAGFCSSALPIWITLWERWEADCTFSGAVHWQFSVISTQEVVWKKFVSSRTVNRFGIFGMIQSKVTFLLHNLSFNCIQLIYFLTNQCPFFHNPKKGLLGALGVECSEHISHTLWDPMNIIVANGGTPPLTYDMFVVCYIIR